MLQATFDKDFNVVIRTLRKLVLTKQVITELDKINRGRRLRVYDPLPHIAYDLEYVEKLVNTFQGRQEFKQKIINMIIKETL
jgi:hypothetical protein